MVYLQIDPHSGVPVYRQIMDQVRYSVASGLLQPGDRLPSIRELARLLAVNPTTIVKAYDELAHDHLIELQQGKGAFVAASAPAMGSRQRRAALARLARQLAVEARQLGADDREVLDLVRDELKEIHRD